MSLEQDVDISNRRLTYLRFENYIPRFESHGAVNSIPGRNDNSHSLDGLRDCHGEIFPVGLCAMSSSVEVLFLSNTHL